MLEICWFAGGSYSAESSSSGGAFSKGSMGFEMKRLQTSVDSYLCKTLNIHIQIPAVLPQKRKRKLIIKPRQITQNRLLPHVWRFRLELRRKNGSFVSVKPWIP